MPEYLNEHAQRKAEVIGYLTETSDVLRQAGNINEAESLERLAKNVENDLFSIVLVGEFSAGKSTFLNALMHRRMLPSFTSETTATVNFLRHTEKAPNHEAGIVYYNDGHTEVLQDLSLPTIENVVSTRSDKGKDVVATTIDHVDLFLESDFLKNGIMLVDSPGLNGIAENHLEITRRQIEQSHAAIFMFSADHPGSKSDFEHLEDLKSKSQNIFFVLNKINVINSSEQTVEDVIADLKESYHKKFPEEKVIPKIWPVAANAALVARDVSVQEYQNGEIVKTEERRKELEELSRMEDFENRLLQYLTQGERTKDQLSEPVEKALKQLGAVKKFLDEELELLLKEESPEQLLKEQEKLKEKLTELEREKNSISAPLRNNVGKSIKNLKANVGAKIEKIIGGINDNLDIIDTVTELQVYADEVEDDLNSKFARLTRTLKSDVYDEIMAVVQEKCYEYITELANAFDDMQGEELKVRKVSLELKEITLSAGLEQFDKEVKEMDAKIAEMEQTIDELEVKKINVRREEAALEDLKLQRKELKDRRNYIIDHSPIPAVERYYDTEEYYRERQGFFGAVAQFFSGKKKDMRKVERINDEAQRTAIASRARKMKDVDDEIKIVEEQLKNAGVLEVCSEEIILSIKRNERKKAELENEILKKQNELQEKMEKNAKTQMRALKKQIKRYADERGNDFEELLKKYLNEQQKEYLDTINKLVTMNIEKQLTDYHTKLEKIINDINTSGEERTKKIEDNQALLLKIKNSMEKGVELTAKLETNLNDKIEQENLV